MKNNREFYDWIAKKERYENCYRSNNRTVYYHLISRINVVVSIVNHMIPKKLYVCEVGCGEGHIIKKINSDFKVGVDISYERLRLAKNNMSGNSCLICADADNLPFKEGVFDVVISSEVIEHLNKDNHAIDNIRHILKDRGKLVLTTPSRWGFRENLMTFINETRGIINRFGGDMRYEHSGHINVLGIKDVKKIMKRSGLRTRQIFMTGLYIPLISEVVLSYKKIPKWYLVISKKIGGGPFRFLKSTIIFVAEK